MRSLAPGYQRDKDRERGGEGKGSRVQGKQSLTPETAAWMQVWKAHRFWMATTACTDNTTDSDSGNTDQNQMYGLDTGPCQAA